MVSALRRLRARQSGRATQPAPADGAGAHRRNPRHRRRGGGGRRHQRTQCPALRHGRAGARDDADPRGAGHAHTGAHGDDPRHRWHHHTPQLLQEPQPVVPTVFDHQTAEGHGAHTHPQSERRTKQLLREPSGSGNGSTTTPSKATTTETGTSTSEAKSKEGSSGKNEQPTPILLDTNAATTYNPYNYPESGFGDPALAIDGEPATAWTAQVQAHSFPNMAEGLLVDLREPTKLGSIELRTPTPGDDRADLRRQRRQGARHDHRTGLGAAQRLAQAQEDGHPPEDSAPKATPSAGCSCGCQGARLRAGHPHARRVTWRSAKWRSTRLPEAAAVSGGAALGAAAAGRRGFGRRPPTPRPGRPRSPPSAAPG